MYFPVLFCLSVSMIGFEDRLRNDLGCARWDVKLHSNSNPSQALRLLRTLAETKLLAIPVPYCAFHFWFVELREKRKLWQCGEIENV